MIPAFRYQLYLWFCEYLQGAELMAGGQFEILMPEFMLKAVGFESEDAMLPSPGNVHSGYRVLQSFSATPIKFSFFDGSVVFLALL